jgi:hypothetical protein
MKYAVDSEYRRVTVQLAACDLRGCTHVPLARAILRQSPTKLVEVKDTRTVTVTYQYNGARLPEASFAVAYNEMTDQDFIGLIAGKAQTWLSTEMTRLLDLRESLLTLETAFPRELPSED